MQHANGYGYERHETPNPFGFGPVHHQRQDEELDDGRYTIDEGIKATSVRRSSQIVGDGLFEGTDKGNVKDGVETLKGNDFVKKCIQRRNTSKEHASLGESTGRWRRR